MARLQQHGLASSRDRILGTQGPFLFQMGETPSSHPACPSPRARQPHRGGGSHRMSYLAHPTAQCQQPLSKEISAAAWAAVQIDESGYTTYTRTGLVVPSDWVTGALTAPPLKESFTRSYSLRNILRVYSSCTLTTRRCGKAVNTTCARMAVDTSTFGVAWPRRYSTALGW
eukprot:2437543-Amphidinium_carterae.3